MARKLMVALVLCALVLTAVSCGGGSNEYVDGSSHWGEMNWDETIWR